MQSIDFVVDYIKSASDVLLIDASKTPKFVYSKKVKISKISNYLLSSFVCNNNGIHKDNKNRKCIGVL